MKTYFANPLAALLLAIVLCLSGCAGPGSAFSAPSGPPKLTMISVAPSSITLAPGATTVFAAVAYDQFNKPLTVQPTFTWTNANPDGSVTAVNTTNASIKVSITAASGGIVSAPAVMTVTSSPAVLTTVTISPATSTINAPGGTQKYTTAALDQFGNPYPALTCTWVSSDPNAATITSGIATAVNTTTAVLTTIITAACGSFSPTATLNVNPPPFVHTISVKPVTLPAYSAALVPVIATDEYGNSIPITVPITIGPVDSTIANVTNSTTAGMLSVGGVAAGQTNVALSIGEATAVMSVTVTPCLPVSCYTPVVTTITVSCETLTMEPQGTQVLTASSLDQHGAAFAGAVYTWTSNNTAVLTVDANGTATGVAIGNTTITASSGGVVGTSPSIFVGLQPYPTTPVIVSTFPTFAVAKNYGTATEETLIPHSTDIVINGSGFLTGAAGCFGSDCTPTQTTFKSSTKLVVTVPWQDLTTAGSVNITVVNPAMVGYSTVGETSNVMPFNVTTKGFVSITFDDGFKTGYRLGTPLFNGQSPSIPTTQFIITGDDCASRGATDCGGSLLRSDGKPWGCIFDADANGAPVPSPEPGPCTQIGVGAPAYVTWANVAYLASMGNEIAPHTRSHNYLSYLTPSDRTNELQGAYNDLLYHATAGVDTVAGYNVSPVMAYPYGDYGCYPNDPSFNSCVTGRFSDQQVGTDVKSAGFRGARTSDEGFDGGVKFDQLNCPITDSCWAWSDLPIFMHTIAGGQADGNTCTFLGGTKCDYNNSGAWFDPTQLSCPQGTSTAGPGFQCWVDSAVANGDWLTLLFHRVNDNTAADKSLSVNSTELKLLADYLHAQGITVVTFGEGLAIEGINGQSEPVNSGGQITVFPSPVN